MLYHYMLVHLYQKQEFFIGAFILSPCLLVICKLWFLNDEPVCIIWIHDQWWERDRVVPAHVGTLLAEDVCHVVWWCSCRLENHTSEQPPGTASLSSYKTDQFCLVCVGICLWFRSLPTVNCWSCCWVSILFWLSWQQNCPKDTKLHSLPAHQPQLMMSCWTIWARQNCSHEVAHSWLLQMFSHLVTWVLI